MKSIKQLLIVFSIAGVASVATAQTTNIILQTDFDGDGGEGNLNNDYGYAYAGSSAGTALAGYSGALTAGAGVDGTVANSISPDYTLLPTDPNWNSPSLAYVYAGVGNGTQFGAPMTAITPTAVLDSFILSADLQVLGLLPGLTTADITISKVQFLSAGAVIFDFTGDAGSVGSNFVHISVPLSSLTYGGANGGDATHPISDLTNAAVVGSIDSFTIEFASQGLPVGTIGGNPLISPPFGFTDTGALVVDNIQLIQTGNTVPTPLQEKLIAQVNFDNQLALTNYGYSFSDVGAVPVTAVTNDTGVGGSIGLQVTADCSSWMTIPPVSFSGWGTASRSLIPYTLTSSNKASYRLYITTKAGGFLPGITNGPGAVSVQFLAPDGTLSAPDGQPDVIFELEPNITLTTNFQSFVFDGASMPSVPYNGGSQAQFNQYFSQIYAVNIQVQAIGDTSSSPTVWGYDSDNSVTVDNLKLVQLAPGLPPVSVTNTNSQVRVYWADPATGGTAQLQSSTSVAGLYLNISSAASGAASPYVVPAGSANQFFRTVWVP
jgi:hypothetical protein